jgi:hypothetical protein
MYSQLIFESILDNSKQALIDVLKQSDIQVTDKQKQIIIEQFIKIMSLEKRKVETPVEKLVENPVEKSLEKPVNKKESLCKPINNKLNINSQKCICRVWNTGLGTQCTRDKKQGNFCKAHSKKYEEGKLDFGIVTEPKPTHYSKNTDLKGKTPGYLIKWKEQAIESNTNKQIKEEDESVSELTKILKKDELSSDEDIEDILQHEPDFGSQIKIQDTILKSDKKLDVHNILEEDVSVIEPDDLIELDGILYEQCILEDSVVYICNKDGKKIAQWNGHDKSTIEWNSKADEDNHKQLSLKKK